MGTIVAACIYLVTLSSNATAGINFAQSGIEQFRPNGAQTQVVFAGGRTETVKVSLSAISAALNANAACRS